MSHEFFVGQKVVCVPWHGSRLSVKAPANAAMPVLGRTYTIRDVIDCGDVVLLRVNELDNTHLGRRKEPGFNTSGFRPLRERKSDISIFTAILNGHRVPEGA